MHTKQLLHLLPFGLMLLSGCAVVPTTPETLDAEAKAFAVAPGKANIYVARTGSVGSAVGMQTLLDGNLQGLLAFGTYQLLTVDPGDHTVICSFANQNPAELKLTVEAGRNYFLTISLKAGLFASSAKLVQLGETKGRAVILNLKRAEIQAQ